MALSPGIPGAGLGDAFHLERRKHARQGAELAVRVGEARATVVDISPGGMRLQAESAVPLFVGTQLRFQLPEDNANIESSYTLAWANESGQAGVSFTSLSEAAQAALERWLKKDTRATEGGALSTGVPPLAAGGGGAPLSRLSPDAAEGGAALSVDREIEQLEQPVSEAGTPWQVLALKELIASANLDREGTYRLVVRRMQALTAADGAALALRTGEAYECVASKGAAPPVGVRLNPEQGLTGECIRTATVVLCGDASEDPRIAPEVRRELQLRSTLLFPICTGGSVRGVLAVFAERPQVFDRGDIVTLSCLADLVTALEAEEAGPGEGGEIGKSS